MASSYPCTDDPNEVIEKVIRAKLDADKLDKFVNGGVLEEVQLGAGEPTPVLRNLVHLVKSAAADLDGSDASGKFSDAANGGETLRMLADRFGDIVNVKDFGAIGDGVANDSSAIQDAIDSSPGKTIWFPDGVYLVSSPIKTSATDDEKTFLNLSLNATIKASSSFVGDFVIELGYDGTASSYSETKHPTGFSAGDIDCSSICGGIRSQKTHLALLQCFYVINCATIGVDIEESNNSSADAYVSNVHCLGVNGSNVNTIGFYVNSFDNDLRDIRCAGFHTGVHAIKGGYISNAHPLFGTMDENYDSSVGFYVGNNLVLVSCYADNFSTAFKQYAGNAWYGYGLIAFWYTNTNNVHCCISCPDSEYFRGNIDGLWFFIPSNGTNYGLKIKYNATLGVYGWSDFDNHGIRNLRIDEGRWANLTYKETDPMLCSRILKVQEYYSRNTGISSRIEIGKWYPLVVANGGDLVHDLAVRFQNKLCFDLKVRFGRGGLVKERLQVFRNVFGASMTFKSKVVSDPQGHDCYILYFKLTSIRSGIDYDATYLSNFSVATVGRQLQAYIFVFPRTAYNDASDFNGITDIGETTPGEFYIDGDFFGGGIESSSCVDWSTSFTIKNVKANSPIMIFIDWDDKNAVYLHFNHKTRLLYSSVDTTNITITETSGTIVVNTPTTALVSYMLICRPQ